MPVASLQEAVAFLESEYLSWIKKDRNDAILVTFTNTQNLLLYLKKTLWGVEIWDLISNQQMGLKAQKNLGLLILSEVERGS